MREPNGWRFWFGRDIVCASNKSATPSSSVVTSSLRPSVAIWGMACYVEGVSSCCCCCCCCWWWWWWFWWEKVNSISRCSLKWLELHLWPLPKPNQANLLCVNQNHASDLVWPVLYVSNWSSLKETNSPYVRTYLGRCTPSTSKHQEFVTICRLNLDVPGS